MNCTEQSTWQQTLEEESAILHKDSHAKGAADEHDKNKEFRGMADLYRSSKPKT